MSDLFFQLGRKLGRAAIPAAQKTRWTWRLFTGSEEESIQAETEMGAAMARGVALAAPDATVQADTEWLGAICGNLAERLRVKGRAFKLSLIHTGAPTAFSLPGGFVFLDTRVSEVCDRNDHHLAFLLAHEMGHVVRRHALKRWVTGLGIDFISTLIRRGAVGPWWNQQGRELLRSAYNQDHEFEADEFGLRLTRSAGYDPAGAFDVLERLAKLRAAGGLGEQYATHPAEAVRLERLRKVLAEVERRLGRGREA